MQWVVTTGSTVEEARQRALDVLGIDESDLELEVIEPGAKRLFGLRTTPARVRARVRPTRPRPKVDRRTRRNTSNSRRRRSRRTNKSETSDTTDAPPATTESQVEAPAPADEPNEPDVTTTPERPTRDAQRPTRESATPMSDIALEEQEPTAVAFVTGLVEAFGLTATVDAARVDDEALEIDVSGDDLGLLVGQRGSTLSSIAELTRTAVAQQHSGRLEGRLRVDIAGYRAKRKEALIRFAGQVAEKVVAEGKSVALEPMSPPDRKIVHDAINEIEGVHTSSRGEDRNRHVVVHPD